MTMDLDPEALRQLRAAMLGEPERPDPADELFGAIKRAGVFGGTAAGHQASASEKAGAYEQFAAARERLYGRPPGRERIRGSLIPEGASPTVRKIFGGSGG